MDCNGQRFWLLADAGHWRWREHARWDAGCRALCLASERSLPEPAQPAAAHAAANSALEVVPRTVDADDGVAYWHAGSSAVVARSHLPGEAVRLPLAEAPSDIVVGWDGVLYAIVAGSIRLHDLRGRWSDVNVGAAGFAPWRAAADPDGGLWVLERASGRLARLRGMPMTVGPFGGYAGTTFRPDPENCHEPELEPLADPAWPAGERPVALALHRERGLALLSWADTDGHARLRFWDARTSRLGAPFDLEGARYAYALDFVDEAGQTRAVVRIPDRNDAPAFVVDSDDADGDAPVPLQPCGDIYPLAAEAIEAPFAHRLDGPPRYPIALDAPVAGLPARGVESLHRLSLSNLARHGEARHFRDDGSAPHLIDSGAQQTVWHRLYAEALLPARAGFIAWCAATTEPQPPEIDDVDAWLPHRFGDVPGDIAIDAAHAPRAAWESAPSELPHHSGLAPWPREAQRAGLWSVLVQDSRRRVRRLVGRYLWLRLELFGDGLVGPEIAAMRAWGSRFSYRDHYLPRLYHEDHHGVPALLPGEAIARLAPSHGGTLDDGGTASGTLLQQLRDGGVDVGDANRIAVIEDGRRWLLRDAASQRAWRLRADGDAPASTTAIEVYRPQATPADFLERLLCNFEGVLTPLEERIASAHLLSDPTTVPEPQLDWLGSWVGVAFDPALPQARRRAWLRHAPQLARDHGTRRGLELALEIASDGGVSGGEIVVIEDFRLRRLLATLLGVDLNEANDPLLPGLIVSGNSVVGDTLVLGEEATGEEGTLRAELMALFRNEVATQAENDAVREFHGRLAHRATVLVHQQVSPTDLGLLRRIVELETPAHTQVRVVAATWPFLVGLASLVGIDSYLGRRPPRRPARVDVSTAGGGDFVQGSASLDPRVSGASAAVPTDPPTADAGDDMQVRSGLSFDLDGSRSQAAPGRRIDSYVWRRLPPSG
ncbi:phage tail protein [Montanilutibacter psychrotolerans]|uniref:Phage tail protein n=1 Tax=Montanilutibacter psychrotolerans TaxID=1327343 RepID=A0A3M8SXZ7_9GAMM|nr:phage tail protein [Lysobacter psychrotolerans]RNF86197.1 phage tail protein [Lysobacter psychrotolerans]